MSFKTSTTDNTFKAGDTLKMTATITNTGAAPLHRIKAISKSDNRLFSDREFVFGKVEPGKSRTWTVEYKSPKDADNRQDLITFDISDDARSLGIDKGLAVTTIAQPKPHFAFDYEVLDANKDGLLQPGEDVKLRVFVKNTGTATSKEPLVYLKNKSGRSIYLKRGREKLKNLEAGKEKFVEFSFKVADKSTRTKPIKMEIDVYDINMREFTQKEIKLPLAAALTLKSLAKKKLVLIPAQTTVYSAPDKLAKPLLSPSSLDATMTITHEAGEWYKGTVGARTGWVLKTQVKPNDGTLKSSSINYFEKPTLKLSTNEMLTTQDKIKLTANINDESGIKDYYIFVYNRAQSTINTKKVMYKRANATTKASGPTQITFMQDIPLFKGMNRIAVYARDKEGMTSVESAYVYKK
jgi:carboxyl-terminal processing protease